MNFWMVTYVNMCELPKWTETTQRQLHPYPTQALETDHKTWKPEAHCTTCRQLDRLKSGSLGWSLPFNRQLSLSKCLSSNLTVCVSIKKKVPSVSGQFQEHPGVYELFGVTYFLNLDQSPFRTSLDLTSLLPKWNVSIQRFLCNISSPHFTQS